MNGSNIGEREKWNKKINSCLPRSGVSFVVSFSYEIYRIIIFKTPENLRSIL